MLARKSAQPAKMWCHTNGVWLVYQWRLVGIGKGDDLRRPAWLNKKSKPLLTHMVQNGLGECGVASGDSWGGYLNRLAHAKCDRALPVIIQCSKLLLTHNMSGTA